MGSLSNSLSSAAIDKNALDAGSGSPIIAIASKICGDRRNTGGRKLMPKRFTDTDIWKTQRWFKKLPAPYKLAFLYIKDQCNHAGIWNIACADLIEDVGLSAFDLDQFIAACNTEYDKLTGAKVHKERIRVLDGGYLWLTGFVQFQYEGKGGDVVPARSGAIKTALQILSGWNLLNEAIIRGYITLTQPTDKGEIPLKDKDKDKDQDKDKVKVEYIKESKTFDSTITIPDEPNPEPETPPAGITQEEVIDGIFNDEMFIENLQMVHKGKDLKRAFAECFLHHSSGVSPPGTVGEWKQKLNTWLINTKNGTSKTTQRTTSTESRREGFAKRHSSDTGG
jgi:hypothetical protein